MTLPQAAYTAPGCNLPAYINARREVDPGDPAETLMIVSVRSDGAQGPAEIRMQLEDFQQWLADAMRIAK